MRSSNPAAAFDIYDGKKWVVWCPAASLGDARRQAIEILDDMPNGRYVLYNRSGLAIEEGPCA